MNTPQGGIFALGTASHAYLEFSVRDESSGPELVRTISALREPRTTMGGVNLVVGFRPELWREVSGGELPTQLGGSAEDLVGADGFVMPPPSTTPPCVGKRHDVTSTSRALRSRASRMASLEERISSWRIPASRT
jgi:putative iron-dependent peroxidase